VYNSWIKGFDYGIFLKHKTNDELQQELDFSKSNLFIFYNDNKPIAFVSFSLVPEEIFSSKLEIKRIAWTSSYGIKAIFNFLANHKDQCHKIRWMAPKKIQISYLMKEVRIPHSVYYQWMARPINLLKFLEAKFSDSKINFTFSVKDDFISENTGTYIVKDGSIDKKPYSGENIIPLDILSSLISGTVNLSGLLYFGVINGNFDKNILSSENKGIYLSEFF